MELSNRTLVDKIVLNHLSVVDIEDMESLLERGVITDNPYDKIRYMTASGKQFSKLEIKNKGFKLTVKAAMIGGRKMDIGSLTLTICNEETRNLHCQTVDDIYQRLLKIQDDLFTDYGIVVDFSNLQIREIELCKTFELEHDFACYSRPLKLIMSNLPNKFKVGSDWKNQTEKSMQTNTYVCKTRNKKTYEQLKFYNKSAQLKEELKITLDKHVVRVEVTLVGAEKVKIMGSTTFAKLTDDKINDFFDCYIEKTVIESLEKWRKSRDKKLLEMMKSARESSLRTWQTDLLRQLTTAEIADGCPVILDISELGDLLSQLGLSKSRKSNVLKSFREECCTKEFIFVQDDDKKLEEIVSKLTPKVMPNPKPVKSPKKPVNSRKTGSFSKKKGSKKYHVNSI